MFEELYQSYKGKCSVPNKIHHLVLENFGGPVCSGPFAGEWFLPVEILETADTFIIRAEIPEVTAEEMGIEILGNLLSIRFKKMNKVALKNGPNDLGDEENGFLKYDIELPAAVLSEYCDADLQKGTLYIEIPKAEKPLAKKISVRTH